MFFRQSCGVQNVLHALALVPPAAGKITTLTAVSKDDPETQCCLLQVVGKLPRIEATKAHRHGTHRRDRLLPRTSSRPTTGPSPPRASPRRTRRSRHLPAIDRKNEKPFTGSFQNLPFRLYLSFCSTASNFEGLQQVRRDPRCDGRLLERVRGALSAWSPPSPQSPSLLQRASLESPKFVDALVALFGFAELSVVHTAW